MFFICDKLLYLDQPYEDERSLKKEPYSRAAKEPDLVFYFNLISQSYPDLVNGRSVYINFKMT